MNSGSFNTNAADWWVDPSTTAYFTFTWNSTPYIAENKTVIHWSVTLQGNRADVFSRRVDINGITKGAYGYPYDNNYPQDNHVVGWVMYSGDTTVYHNADGTGSFTAEVWGNVYQSYPAENGYNCHGKQTFTLDTIPRNAANITAVSLSNTKYTYSGTDYIVAGYSTTTFTPTITMGDAPSIQTYRLWQGNTLVKEWAATPLTFTVPQITSNTASIAYKMSVIDSYGMESNKFDCTAFTAYKYTRGSATSDPLTQRCTSNGTLDEEGTYAKCVISFSKSKIGTTQITTTITATINGSSGTSTTSPTSIIVGGGTLLNNKSYAVSYKLSDLITTTPVVIATDIISVSFYTMHITADGKGIAFGQAATSGYFDIDNMEFRVNEGISTSANHGKMAIGFLSGDNQNHGLYSYGYINSSNSFVSDPKWLIRRKNDGTIEVAGMSSATYTNKVSRSSGGTIGSQTLTVNGKVAMLTLQITGNGSSISNRGYYFRGTIDSAFKPASDVICETNWYEHSARGTLFANGNIDIMVIDGASAFNNGDTDLVVSFTYLLA